MAMADVGINKAGRALHVLGTLRVLFALAMMFVVVVHPTMASAGIITPGASTFTFSGGSSLTVGTQVTLTMTVKGQSSYAATVPTGNVTFADGSSALGTVQLDSTGVAKILYTPTTTGTHFLSATYNGDSTFAADEILLTPNAYAPSINTTTLISSIPTTVTSGVSFNVTVTVSTASGLASDGAPTGTVTLYDGATMLGVGQLTATTATSSVTTISATLTRLGYDQNISASYAGSSPYQPSSSGGSTGKPVDVVVGGSTTTTVTSSLNPSLLGDYVTFTATVTGGSSPTGTVIFTDGSTQLGSGALGSTGKASIGLSTLTLGSHTINASYSGDTNNPSSQGMLTQTVNPVTNGEPTTTTLQSSINPSMYGQQVTFTAKVTSVGGGKVNVGMVTFKDGATQLCAVSVDSIGNAACVTSALATGAHTITAAYSGYDLGATSFTQSSASLVQQVNAASLPSTVTTVMSSLNPSQIGQSVTFTATVTDGSSPTGNVTFRDGSVTLGSGALNGAGMASFATSSLTAGSHRITAVYAGDTYNAGSTSASLTQQVNAASTAALTISETLSPTTYSAAGVQISPSFTVQNIGNTSISNIQVSDTLGLQNIACLSTTLAAGGSTTCSGTYSTTAADVTNGKVIDAGQVTGTPASGTLTPVSSSQVTATYQAPQVSVTAREAILPTRYTGVGQQLTVSVSVTNPNTSALTSLSVNDARAGTLICPATSIAAQATVVCTGTFLTVAADLTAYMINDHAVVSGQVLAVAVNASPSSQILSAAAVPASQTQSDISSFLNQRANTILSQEPERSRIESRLSSSSQWSGDQAGGPVSFMMSGMDATGTMSLSTSLAKIQKSAGLGWDVWTEIHAGAFTNNSPTAKSSGNFVIGYGGLDYLITPDLLVGALVEMDSMRESTTTLGAPGVSADGIGWMVGPYLGMRVLPHVFFDTRAALGLSDDHVSPVSTFVDKFSTERGLLEARLSGNWVASSFTIAPSARLSYLGERQNGFVDAQGISVAGQYVSLGQTAFGVDLSRAFNFGIDTVIEPKISLQEIWDFSRSSTIDASGPLPPSIPRGRVDVGATLKTSRGLSLSALISYDGIGTANYHSVTGKVSVNVPLH